ncbi:glucosaminidase domain-containing protein [Pseudohongiella spirulinae]|uniref:FlgJ n=1 Tax=Pseudohongiella spirulinae TaxID=1249552 RepID=A0A0S2KD58_9GAMM|nr:glucosaminidase domain-containing protein [Pseudohongiella spirulinae]ALO46035.1 FlgJ [Pseudohongiella spirulinae]
MMLDLLRHPRLPVLARAGMVGVLAAFTFTAFAQYRQSGNLLEELNLDELVSQDDSASESVVTSELPDFESYGDIDVRKAAFFEFLAGYVQDENAAIRAKREELLPMWEVVKSSQPLSSTERARLQAIASEYRLADAEMTEYELVRELIRRVDVLPASLVLAQAANESGWGMSRFARQGNNIFGQWCFDEGCGLVPERRGGDASHEVRAFASVEASVKAYFRNINTHRSYEDLRVLREAMRMQDMPLDSMVLARGLTGYSERGQAYVSELQDIIRINQLKYRDNS